MMEIPTSGLSADTLSKSYEGAVAIAPHVETLREQVFSLIAAAGDNGITDRDLQIALNIKGNTQRPRRWELWISNRIKVKRDADGNPVYRRAGVRSKRIVWTVGPERACHACGQIYTKTFDRQHETSPDY